MTTISNKTEQAARIARMRATLAKPQLEFDQTEPGSSVVGVVVELNEAESEFGVFPVLLVDDGEALMRVACARTKIRNAILGHDVRVGDAIAIAYLGKSKTAKGVEFHDYRFHHEPADPRPEPPRIPSVEDVPPVDEFDPEEPS
jgi:hypothetical protein